MYLCDAPWRDHITSVLRQLLHWLPMKQRIDFTMDRFGQPCGKFTESHWSEKWPICQWQILVLDGDMKTMNSEQFVAVTAPPPINYPIDVVFVVDVSGNVGSENFTTMKSFLSQIISRLDIDSGNTRVGLVTFATNVRTVFNLTDHSSMQSLQSAISSLRYTGGGTTNTAAALHYVRTRMLTSASGDRPNVHNNVVVITYGKAENFNSTVVSTTFVTFLF